MSSTSTNPLRRSPRLVIGLIAGCILGSGAVVAAQTTTATSADFCVKDKGQIRLVTDGACDSNETLYTIVGEQGPVGPAGADGADGQDGVDGVDGVNGTNGVDGQDGVDGVNGIDGQDGADGVSGYEIVELPVQWGGGGLQRDVTIMCPPGKHVLSVGYDRLGAYTQPSGDIDVYTVYTNEPVLGGTGWYFEVAGDFSGPIRERVFFAICADV